MGTFVAIRAVFPVCRAFLQGDPGSDLQVTVEFLGRLCQNCPPMTTLFGILFALLAGAPPDAFTRWSMDKAVQMLNTSPWARQETFTRVISGVGSGISGEKEIYNTFYIRFLSARPIREAYARVQQLNHGYDNMPIDERRHFDKAQRNNLDMDMSHWIVVSISYRSNDPNEESSLRRFFQSETAKTLKNKAYLSTPSFPQLEVSEYFPPREESVGAKFVFPREVNGVPILSKDSGNLTFELLEFSGAKSRLRATFAVKPMVVDGELLY